MEWIPYKAGNGEFARHESGLILTAWPTGAWAVHDPQNRVPVRASSMKFRATATSMAEGKREAEEAMNEMLKSLTVTNRQ